MSKRVTQGILFHLFVQLESDAEYAKFAKAQWLETTKFHWQTFKDPDLVRKFKKISKLGELALPEDKYEKVRFFPLVQQKAKMNQ